MLEPYHMEPFYEILPNQQVVIYGVRISATAADGADSFTNYTLLYVTYRPATRDDLDLAGVEVSDEYQIWRITDDDLALAGAPIPQVSYTLSPTQGDIAGETWIILKATRISENKAHECLCRKSR